jgi:putative transposase
MKRTRFTTEQIIAMLQEHRAGAEVGELARRHGFSKGTLYVWTQRFGELQVSEARRLQALEDENRRLKRLVADQELNLQILKDVLGKDS